MRFPKTFGIGWSSRNSLTFYIPPPYSLIMNPTLKKYAVTVQFLTVQTIEVMAKSKDEAMDIVGDGEFEANQITHISDEQPEIVGVAAIK